MSPTPEHVDLSVLLNTVQRFAAGHFPGSLPHRLTIQFRDGNEVVLPVPAAPIAPTAPAGVRLTDRQQDLVAAVEEAGDRVLQGKEVAKKAGYEYGPEVRKDLSYLARCGLLVSCSPGYKLGDGGPPAGAG